MYFLNMKIYTSLEQLKGYDISEFKLVKMWHIYTTDDDGRINEDLGLFINQKVIKIFSSIESYYSGKWYSVHPLYVLTNGKVGYMQHTFGTKQCRNEINALRKIRSIIDDPRLLEDKMRRAAHKLMGLPLK